MTLQICEPNRPGEWCWLIRSWLDPVGPLLLMFPASLCSLFQNEHFPKLYSYIPRKAEVFTPFSVSLRDYSHCLPAWGKQRRVNKSALIFQKSWIESQIIKLLWHLCFAWLGTHCWGIFSNPIIHTLLSRPLVFSKDKHYSVVCYLLKRFQTPWILDSISSSTTHQPHLTAWYFVPQIFKICLLLAHSNSLCQTKFISAYGFSVKEP